MDVGIIISCIIGACILFFAFFMAGLNWNRKRVNELRRYGDLVKKYDTLSDAGKGIIRANIESRVYIEQNWSEEDGIQETAQVRLERSRALLKELDGRRSKIRKQSESDEG